jgi:hypothetical protein
MRRGRPQVRRLARRRVTGVKLHAEVVATSPAGAFSEATSGEASRAVASARSSAATYLFHASSTSFQIGPLSWSPDPRSATGAQRLLARAIMGSLIAKANHSVPAFPRQTGRPPTGDKVGRNTYPMARRLVRMRT